MIESLRFGLEITVIGMTLVLSILGLIWGAITLLLRFDNPTPCDQKMDFEPAMLPEGADDELISAITIAILTHRQERRKEAGPETRRYAPGSRRSQWVVVGRTRQHSKWQPRS